MFWLLLAALVLLSLVVLGATLLTLWRRLRALGREVAEAGATIGQVGDALQGVQAGRETSCPTCGGPAPVRTPARTPARTR